MEEVMAENGTTISKATTTILAATIALIFIGIYQLKKILYLPFQQSIQLQKIVKVDLKETTT